MALRVFVVDDDPDYAQLITYQLQRAGEPTVHRFETGEDAIASLDLNPDLVFLDIVMPGQGGLETLKKIKQTHASIPVVIVSSQSVVAVALEAMKRGAYDYLTKGYDDTVKIRAIAEQILHRVRQSREIDELRAQLPARQGLHGMIGESEAMAQVFRTIKKTLRGDLTVAIVGESGTGKELVAQAIHYNSDRRREPFVLVNCAAIPRDLMESEFFGHEKGSFTGAHAKKIGKFEQAHGGTIFLDEIGELDLSLQAKLLRVLQNREVQRVGGNETIQVDVRILCATNRDARKMIADGKFREDLYYRLFQFPLELPPLRERDQDILLLAEHFRSSFLANHDGIESRNFSAATRRFILGYPWPGNVRELKSAVERSLLISDSEEIMPEDLMLQAASPLSPAGPQTERIPHPTTHAEVDVPLPESDPMAAISMATTPDEIIPLDEIKAIAVKQAYDLCQGNINQTATRLGVTRSTVYRLMKKFAIDDNE